MQGTVLGAAVELSHGRTNSNSLRVLFYGVFGINHYKINYMDLNKGTNGQREKK